MSAGILALVLITIAIHDLIKPAYKYMASLAYINFDIITLIKGYQFNFSFIQVNYTNVFYAFVIFSLGMIIIYFAHIYTKESWKSRGRLAVPAYLILYSFLLTIVWVGIAFDFMRGKIQKW
jgi:hypothetical protein